MFDGFDDDDVRLRVLLAAAAGGRWPCMTVDVRSADRAVEGIVPPALAVSRFALPHWALDTAPDEWRLADAGDGPWFWVPPASRGHAEDAASARRALAERLCSREHLTAAERLRPGAVQDAYIAAIALLVDAGDVDAAVNVYWHGMGNFSKLSPAGRYHAGALACRLLNGGQAPTGLSPSLAAARVPSRSSTTGASSRSVSVTLRAACCRRVGGRPRGRRA